MSETSKVVSDRDRARLRFKESVIELAAARGQEDDVIDKLIVKVNEAFDALLNSHVELVLSSGETLSDETHENFMYEASDERDEAVEEAEEEKVKAKKIIKEKTIKESTKVDNLGLMGKKDQEEFFDKKLEISHKVSQEVAESELFSMFSAWAYSQITRLDASPQSGDVPHKASRMLSRISSSKQRLPSIPGEILDGELAKHETEVLYGASGQVSGTDSYDVTAKTTSRELRCEGNRAAATTEHVVRVLGHADSGDTHQSCRVQLERKRVSVVTRSFHQSPGSVSTPVKTKTFSRNLKLQKTSVEVETPPTGSIYLAAERHFAFLPRLRKAKKRPGGSTLIDKHKMSARPSNPGTHIHESDNGDNGRDNPKMDPTEKLLRGLGISPSRLETKKESRNEFVDPDQAGLVPKEENVCEAPGGFKLGIPSSSTGTRSQVATSAGLARGRTRAMRGQPAEVLVPLGQGRWLHKKGFGPEEAQPIIFPTARTGGRAFHRGVPSGGSRRSGRIGEPYSPPSSDESDGDSTVANGSRSGWMGRGLARGSGRDRNGEGRAGYSRIEEK